MESLTLKRRIALEAHRVLMHQRAKEHQLTQLFWECTLRCNIACLHCGSDCKATADVPDMPAADFLKVMEGLRDKVNPNRLMVIITGGEPLLRRDLEEVGIKLYQMGYPWGMVTNGMALTPARLHSLRKAGLHSLTISLDGLEDDHNWMRGTKLGFQRAIAAIRLAAKSKGLTFDVVTCVNSRNLNDLNQIRDLLIGAGVKGWRLFTIFAMGRAADHPELQLDNDGFKQLMQFIKDTRAEGKIKCSYCCEGFLGNYEGEVRNHLYGCNAGISVASIRANGDISGCLSVRGKYDQGNIYRDDFMEVWNSRFEPFRQRSWMRQGICSDCKMWRYCEGNGMHLRRDDGSLAGCHLHSLMQEH